MAKTYTQFVAEASRTTRTGNTLTSVNGGKANLPKLGSLPLGQSPFNYNPTTPKNSNAVPGKAAAPGTRLSDYTPPVVKATTPPQTTMSKIRDLGSKIAGIRKPDGWQHKVADTAKRAASTLPGRAVVGGAKLGMGGLAVYTTGANAIDTYYQGKAKGQTQSQALGRAATGAAGELGSMAAGAAAGAKIGRLGYALGPVVGGITTVGGALVGGALASEPGRELTKKAYDTGLKMYQDTQKYGVQKGVVEPVTKTLSDFKTQAKKKIQAVAPSIQRSMQANPF